MSAGGEGRAAFRQTSAEVAVALADKRQAQVNRRGGAYQEADVEREIARLRAILAPARAQAPAVVDDDRADEEEKRRDHELGARLAKRRPALSPLAHFFVGSPIGRG